MAGDGTDKNQETVISGETRLTVNTIVQVSALLVVAIGGYLAIDARIDVLERKIEAANYDRWTRQDDASYMQRFANENGLLMPQHTRSDP